MKKVDFILVLVFCVLLSACNPKKQNTKDSDSPTIESPYFGQKQPGLTAEIFAPGIVSINGRYDYGISFSPDLDEMYFSANKKGETADIYFSKLEDKKWKPIQKVNFTKGQKDAEMEPFFQADGQRIYFTGYSSGYKDEEIWYVDRLGNGWSNAIKLDSPINDDNVMYLTQAKNGDVFYDNISKRKMYFSSSKNGGFPEVQEVEVEIGSHAFISSSQDYLLVQAQNKEDKKRGSDIYVYFKEKDETWSKPINLGSTVNSNFGEAVPSVTPDGKYLFFSRYNEEGGLSNLYWVSTEIISKLKMTYFKK
ncbi:MAG: PD40 domain-containing protein [Flavobacteriaceae bacterium]|nr:PD40 domain-containing protein [Flavobacteriaceae bacterium]